MREKILSLFAAANISPRVQTDNLSIPWSNVATPGNVTSTYLIRNIIVSTSR